MANAHVLGGGKWKKALEAVSKQAASLKVGVLEGATSEDGESVATYAFYNEFGATVEVPERTQTLYFKRNRDGTVGNRFVRKDKSDFAQDVAVGGHTITIPARPFMRSTVQAQEDAWAKAFADAIFAKAHERDAVVRGLNLLGRKMQDDIVATIKSNLAPDNAESTKRRKNAKGAGKGTLIDKGHLLKSISYEVES